MQRGDESSRIPVALVFSGGVGLGAYQAGAYEVLHSHEVAPDWLAGSSVGAINAALIAGSAPAQRMEILQHFWGEGDFWAKIQSPAGFSGELRHLANWVSALNARLFGVAGHFRPRMSLNPIQPFRSLYDLTPMRERLERLVDFERLNSGDARVSVATTDIETGELVVLDTRSGARIGMEHLLASCGLLPEFAPVEIEGRLLGDGGIRANAPVEIVLDQVDGAREHFVFVLDLFAPDGSRPRSLATSIARKNDLLFGSQTLRILNAYCGSNKCPAHTVFYLSYRAASDEAGPEKMFDLSHATVADRWQTGKLDMADALWRIGSDSELQPLNIVRRAPGARAP